MIDIGNTEFLIAVRSLAKDDFEIYSSHLFDTWDEYIEKSLKVPDYSISLEIEEGSIKGTGKIAVGIGVLYIAIGNYGEFISGLKTIGGQVSYVNDKLVESAASPFEKDNIQTTYRNKSNTLSHLNRLFQKVQKGELTANQAMIEAKLALGEEANTSPEFMQKLNEALESAPKYPKQEPLFEETDIELDGVNNNGDKKKPSRAPTPKPDTPINQFRVEIWRESKRGKKNVKISEL
jgi:hypothetical protein